MSQQDRLERSHNIPIVDSVKINTNEELGIPRKEFSIPVGNKYLAFSVPDLDGLAPDQTKRKIQIAFSELAQPQNFPLNYPRSYYQLVVFLAQKDIYQRSIQTIRDDGEMSDRYLEYKHQLVDYLTVSEGVRLFYEGSGLGDLDETGQNFIREPNKEEQAIISILADQARHISHGLDQKIGTQRDGADFIRHLLMTQDECIIRVALIFVPSQIRGLLQDELMQIYADTSLPRDTRELAQGLIFPERLRLAYSLAHSTSELDRHLRLLYAPLAGLSGHA